MGIIDQVILFTIWSCGFLKTWPSIFLKNKENILKRDWFVCSLFSFMKLLICKYYFRLKLLRCKYYFSLKLLRCKYYFKIVQIYEITDI
jgi:hypothetical protein